MPRRHNIDRAFDAAPAQVPGLACMPPSVSFLQGSLALCLSLIAAAVALVGVWIAGLAFCHFRGKPEELRRKWFSTCLYRLCLLLTLACARVLPSPGLRAACLSCASSFCALHFDSAQFLSPDAAVPYHVAPQTPR